MPPVYSRIWSRSDVILIEPLSKENPRHIDFSTITKNSKGELRVVVRNDPRRDFVRELLKAGKSVTKETIGSNKWERFSVDFDHEDVLLKVVANDWLWEFAFIDYPSRLKNKRIREKAEKAGEGALQENFRGFPGSVGSSRRPPFRYL